MKPQIQSNSMRGEFMHQFTDRAVQEILDVVEPMLGPGATDAFIVKNNAPYYTRDGKEVMESLRFDNELANYIHHILYQAVHRQAEAVGDGTTTLAVVYGHIYRCIRDYIDRYGSNISNNSLINRPINEIRVIWQKATQLICHELEQMATSMNDADLLSMLYTCTQDAELTAKLYWKLGPAIMQGAYIIPRKSNINTDLRTEVYSRPTFKVVKQFSLKPIPDDGRLENCVILHCNGTLSVAHCQVFAGMLSRITRRPDGQTIPITYIILCNGISDRTRETLRELVREIRNHWDIDKMNNLGIFTLTDYRAFSAEETEDLSTIITDEPGLGGLVQGISYENLLYHAFIDPEGMGIAPIEDLERFDMDSHLIDKMRSLERNLTDVIFDSVHGIALDRELGPVAKKRYDDLTAAIKEEKSPVARLDLTRRMRRTYGMFIDVEVGSALMKDSQRKFELVLDAILSASDAVKNGVLFGNSTLHALRIAQTLSETTADEPVADAYRVIAYGLLQAATVLIHNAQVGLGRDEIEAMVNRACASKDLFAIEDFRLDDGDTWWITIPGKEDDPDYKAPEDIIVPAWTDTDGTEYPALTIKPRIMESVGIMRTLLENSQLAMELAMAKTFHISGDYGFMGNYVQEDEGES